MFFSRYRFFLFFLSLAINSICLKYLARSRIHSIEVFTIEEEIEFRIYSFLLSLFIPCPEGMDYAFAWSHYLVHQWSPHHPSIQKENSFSKQWNFVSIPGLSRYRCFAGNPACVASVKRRTYIYIYVCIILDTFRWCFNFAINACLNRASRFGKFIFHAIRADQILFVLYNVRCMLISHLTFRFLLYRN